MPEQNLHSQLKEWLREPSDLAEGHVWGYIADLIRGDQIIEVQTGNFQQIRDKIEKLLKGYRVKIIYPVAQRKWVVRELEGKKSRHVSPRVGCVEEIFNELMYCPELPLNPRFTLEVVLVYIEESQALRWRGKKRARYRVTERSLLKVVGSSVFETPSDYLKLLPDMHGAFTARQLSKTAGLRITLARRMVYCLSKMGLLQEIGLVARAKLYKIKS